MGINGLLPILKPICEAKHIAIFANRRVGIDASTWLHRGAISCALDLETNKPTRRYVDYCMHYVRMLLHFGAVPVLVFDGAPLPMKAATNEKRRATRAAARREGMAALQNGNSARAQDCFAKSVGINHEMTREVIKEIRKLNIEYYVAPYEADAQLAWMSKNGHVDVIVTEDSDLVVYGAEKILYKMDRQGHGALFQSKNLPALDDLDLRNFTPQMLTWVCVIAGCDFFPGVNGLGIRKAHALVKRTRRLPRLLHAIRFDTKYTVQRDFADVFHRACLVFKHQTVFDAREQRHVHLNPLDAAACADVPAHVLHPPRDDDDACVRDFIGRVLEPALARRLAQGHINPRTMEEYATPLDIVERPQTHALSALPMRNCSAFQVLSRPGSIGAAQGAGTSVAVAARTLRGMEKDGEGGLSKRKGCQSLVPKLAPWFRPRTGGVGATQKVLNPFQPVQRAGGGNDEKVVRKRVTADGASTGKRFAHTLRAPVHGEVKKRRRSSGMNNALLRFADAGSRTHAIRTAPCLSSASGICQVGDAFYEEEKEEDEDEMGDGLEDRSGRRGESRRTSGRRGLAPPSPDSSDYDRFEAVESQLMMIESEDDDPCREEAGGHDVGVCSEWALKRDCADVRARSAGVASRTTPIAPGLLGGKVARLDAMERVTPVAVRSPFFKERRVTLRPSSAPLRLPCMLRAPRDAERAPGSKSVGADVPVQSATGPRRRSSSG